MRDFVRYLCAVLAVPLAIGLRYAMTPLIGKGVPYIPLFMVATIVAVFAGMGPAILMSVLAALVTDFFIVPPLYVFEFQPRLYGQMGVMVLTSALVGYVSNSLRETRRRAAAQVRRLHESEHKYRDFVENCGLLASSIDCDCRYIYVNRAFAAFFGCDQDSVPGKTVQEVLGPELGDRVAVEIHQMLDTGLNCDSEHIVTTPSGPRWLHTHRCLSRDGQGKARYITTFMHDITETKQAELQLRTSEEQFRHLVNYAGFIVIRCSLDGIIRYINDMAWQYRGRRFENCVGRHIIEVWGPGGGEAFMSGVRRAVEKGKDIEMEVEIPSRDGMRWFWSRYNLMKDAEGRPDCVIIFAHDITKEKLAGIQLQRSETSFRQLVESAGLMAARWDTDGKLLYMNSLGLAYLGVSAEDIVGRHATEILHPELSKVFTRDIHMILETASDMEQEYEVPLPDGTQWLWSRWSLLRNPDGQVEVATFVRNITEQRLAQKKLQQSEANLRTLVESSGLVVAGFDSDARFTFVNTRGLERVMLKQEDIVGKLPTEAIHLPLAKLLEDCIKESIAYRRPVETVQEASLPIGQRWVHWNINPMVGVDGEVSGAVLFSNDITEAKMTELTLQESEQRRRMLTNLAMEAIFMHDDGILLEANPRFYEMFGYTPDEVIGKDIRALTVAPEWIEMLTSHYRSTDGVSTLATAVRKDGTKFPIETRGVNTHYRGRQVRVAVINDISDRLKAEIELAEIREKMAIVERLAAVGYVGASMAHEVCTPLSVMRLTAQAMLVSLAQSDSNGQEVKQAKAIIREIDRAADIVRRYREMSRPASENDDEPDEIRQVPARVKRVFLESAHRARLQIMIGGEVPDLLVRLGSVNAAEQLMFIMVQNAMQAGDSRKQERLEITGCLKDDNVELRFVDDCRGIPKENLARVFEPFFSTKPRNTGTGLGLSILRRLLQDRGGSINVESELGKGTTFVVTYPA